MKSLPIAVLLAALCTLQASGYHDIQDNVQTYVPCASNGIIEFKRALEGFVAPLYKRAAYYSGYNFAISPLSMWLSLSAIAEGAADHVQRQLFRTLNLPRHLCMRQKFYEIASRLEPPGLDVTLDRTRAFLFNENVNINPFWESFVNKSGLLHYVGFSEDKPGIIDTLEFEGLWTSEFPEGSIQRAPFLDDAGMKIGQINFMRMKKNMRAVYLPNFNAKALELPMGVNGRYTMLIVMALENQPISEIVNILPKSIILDITQALTYDSFEPSDIAVPMFWMRTRFEARSILQEIGIKSIWSDPAAGMNISEPPQAPSEYLQLVNMEINSAGVNPAQNLVEIFGHNSATGDDFIVNKPFMFFLIDDKTKSILLAGAFSHHTA